MSLLSIIDEQLPKLGEKAIEALERKAPEAIDDLLSQGDDLLDKETDGAMAKEGHDALELIRENKTPFIRLGKLGLARLVGHWETGDEAETRRYYLAHEATYEEGRAAMHAAGDALVDARDAELAAWEEVKAILLKIGGMGLKFLVKLAAAQVGIVIP